MKAEKQFLTGNMFFLEGYFCPVYGIFWDYWNNLKIGKKITT